ncbi:MAG TPA: nucleotidyl transferase AbiEii/AbiGii toxin family protein [Solirubrobacteraceae bacterium]|nr:nucleotidyl transferase AbiEii/AbiGii toxin family protein [Solirubrobacteraceae bacterium]
MSELSELLLAVHDSLQEAGIPHAVGGAIALAYCTLDPRGTRDLDFNVFVGTERAREVLAAMPESVEVSGERLERLERDGQVRLMSRTTPVDLFLNVLPFHDHVAEHTREVPFEGRTIPVLTCTALVVFKAMFDRTQDWADIERMSEAHSFDLEEAARWIREMLGDDRRTGQLAAAHARARSQGGPPPLRPPATASREDAG